MTPQEFGELIRTQREARRLTVEDLAMRFKLSASTLRDIERGKLDHLPHAVYARGFVRSYAQAVGVTPEDLEVGIEALFPRHLFDDVPTIPGPINAKPPRPGRDGGDKLVRLALLLAFLALPIVSGWFVITKYGNNIMELIKRPFSATPAGLPAPIPEPAHSAAAPVAPPVRPAVSANAAAPADPASVEPPPQAAAPTPASADETAPSPATASPADIPIDGKHIVIQAREECWVQASVDGEGTRTFTLYPGETSVLPYNRRISLVIGNAGGVSLVHNGQPYAMAGRANEKRTLVFQ